MKSLIFNNFFDLKKPYFTIGYFIVLIIDTIVKVNLEPMPFRYFSKPLLLILLILFYIKNRTIVSNKNHTVMLLALFLYLIADLALINYLNKIVFLISMFIFMIAKVMYCLRFTNNRDFNMLRLVPFLIGSFFLMIFVYSRIYENLGMHLIPVLIYFFVSLLLFLFAYLRKNDVNTKSYNSVLIAMFFLLLSEMVMVFKLYYMQLPYQDILTIIFYGIAQFLIVYGVTIEVKMIDDELK